MKLPILLIIFLLITVVTLLITNITISNMMSTGGISLNLLQNQLHDLQTKDTIIEQKVLALSSYTQIASEAARMGYAEDKNTVAITAPVSIPLAYQQ